MLARYFVEVILPFEAARRALLRDPHEWLPAVGAGSHQHGEQLLAEIGVGGHVRVHKTVALEIHEPVELEAKVILPLEWRATGATRLFPRLEGDLEIAPLGPNRTQIALNARYDPPFGAVGRAIDRALLHRVAEATVRDFVDRTAAAIERACVAA